MSAPTRMAYQYVVLRCVPRPEREEFLNVGVVLHCQAADFLDVAWSVDAERLRALHAGIDVDQVCDALAFAEQAGRRQQLLGVLVAGVGQHHLAGLLVDVIVAGAVDFCLARELRHQHVDLGVQLRTALGGAGEPVAWLTWEAPRPGATQLRRMLPAVLALSYLVMGRWFATWGVALLAFCLVKLVRRLMVFFSRSSTATWRLISALMPCIRKRNEFMFLISTLEPKRAWPRGRSEMLASHRSAPSSMLPVETPTLIEVWVLAVKTMLRPSAASRSRSRPARPSRTGRTACSTGT